jgi:hypothetical protein
MSKVQEYTDAGFASPDPVNEGYTVLTFKVSVRDMVLEAGWAEQFAQVKGWDGQGNACEGIQNWLKTEARGIGEMLYVAQAVSNAEAIARAEFAQLV